MPDYKNAKIYKLVNDTLGLTYYGSTTKKLSVRKAQHKWKATRENTTSKLLFQGEGKVDIVLIEKFPCNDKEELNKRERFYIENNECVNKNVPCRTHKEWLEDNKTLTIGYRKNWRETHKEEIKEYYEKNKKRAQQKFNCECGGKFTFYTKKKHLETKKHKNYSE